MKEVKEQTLHEALLEVERALKEFFKSIVNDLDKLISKFLK